MYRPTVGLDPRTFCRFDPIEHAYYRFDEVRVPSITQMLARTGWVDDRWYTEESSERGTRVHELTAAYDLGALNLETCVSYYKPWLEAYVEAIARLRPTWLPDGIEHPSINYTHNFGGRPDRACVIFETRSVLEIKTNDKAWNIEKATPIQTALQAILLSARYPLPAEAWNRMAVYLRPGGQFRVEHHRDRRDFDRAYQVIRKCCT
jgi:hypothetical protein